MNNAAHTTLPLVGVTVDRRRLPPAEGAWVAWWGTGWAAADARDALLVGALADDSAALAVCLTQPLAWCRGLARTREAVATLTPDMLRRAVAHVEAHGLPCDGMRPPAEGGRTRPDGLPVRGPTRPRHLVPGLLDDSRMVSAVLAWSWRLWWLWTDDGGQRFVNVRLVDE